MIQANRAGAVCRIPIFENATDVPFRCINDFCPQSPQKAQEILECRSRAGRASFVPSELKLPENMSFIAERDRCRRP